MQVSKPRRHCVISGTGRAGTSFLVHLLTELGLDTGFKPGAITETSGHMDPVALAGLEHDIRRAPAPYIVKSPHLCDYIDTLADDPNIQIDHAIVPIRDLDGAALSRLRVQQQHPQRRLGRSPGGLWDARTLDEQRQVLAQKQYRLLFHLAQMDVPVTLLHFPRCAVDWRYLKLTAVFALDQSEAQFRAVFDAVSRPERIDRAAVAPRPSANGWSSVYFDRRGLRRLSPSGG